MRSQELSAAIDPRRGPQRVHRAANKSGNASARSASAVAERDEEDRRSVILNCALECVSSVLRIMQHALATAEWHEDEIELLHRARQLLAELTSSKVRAVATLVPDRSPSASSGVTTRVTSSAPLTARMREVLQLYSDGLTRPEIATKLCIDRRTVNSHIEAARERLNVHSAQQAVSVAMRLSLIFAPRPTCRPDD